MALLLRALVGSMFLAGLATSSGLQEDFDALVASQILTDPYAYDFPRLSAPASTLFPMRYCHGFVLEEASVDEIQAAFANNTFTIVELLNCYLDRIQQTQPYLK